MIVVDTNIIAYLFLPCEFTVQAISLFRKDPVWAAPTLWRSEFRNVLVLYLRKELIDLTKAHAIQEEAESLLAENEYEAPSSAILSEANRTGCSAYDCEFIVLAKQLGVELVTEDKGILDAAPGVATSMKGCLATRG
ncbi:MAG: type II toxin-antitoxin system VapC family toxin [Candidatus Omnitrophica bacterium]|nr:type II toxin-antitoxin system VapC family toxin [Candidatus Omnitrophota bacterium]